MARAGAKPLLLCGGSGAQRAPPAPRGRASLGLPLSGSALSHPAWSVFGACVRVKRARAPGLAVNVAAQFVGGCCEGLSSLMRDVMFTFVCRHGKRLDFCAYRVARAGSPVGVVLVAGAGWG
jgi:hypothetical protein